MENLCKHNKKNIKTLPVAINAGGLGMIGGVVLLGAALVTATIVSTFAVRSRSQRQRPEKMKKSTLPSPKTQSVDVPNKLELMMDTDFSESEEVVTTSRKEIQTKNIQSLTPDKKHDYGIDNEQVHSGDSNEEDQENTSICVDCDFENEEQVVMAAQIEEDSCLERADDGDEEQKHLMMNYNENDEHVDANSLASDKDIVSEASENEEKVFVNEAAAAAALEAVCVNQVKVEDSLQVRFLAEQETGGHDEIILENYGGDMSDETGSADQILHEVAMEEEGASDAERLLWIEVQNCPQVQLLNSQYEIMLENCEGDLSDKKSPANEIIREGGQQMECDSKQVKADHEFAPEMQVNQVCETFLVMNKLKEVVDDLTAANESTPPSPSTNKEAKDKEIAQKVEKQVTIEDEAAEVEMITEHELVKQEEIPHVESVDEDDESEEDVTVKDVLPFGVGSSEAEISYNKTEETDVQVKVEMITDHELVKKEEIPLVESVKEDEDSEEDVIVKDELNSGSEEDVMVKDELNSGVSFSSMQGEPMPEAKISCNTIDETVVLVKSELVTDHELVKKDEIPHVENVKEEEDGEEDVTVKDELNSGVSFSSVQEEPTPEAKISYNEIDETVVLVKSELITDHELVKKDEIPHIESVEEYENSEEDVTIKAELSSGVGSSSVEEKATPEAKITNHKIEENTEENHTILGKNHDSDDNGVIKEQAFESKPWNLKLMTWSAVISVWCLCHWYSELPFLGLSLVGSLLFILVLLGYHNRAAYAVKYE